MKLWINTVNERFQLSKGRIHSIDVFNESLKEEINKTFPNEWNAFQSNKSVDNDVKNEQDDDEQSTAKRRKVAE